MLLGNPVRVGLVGTGFVAKLRAEALLPDAQGDWLAAKLVAVAGRTPEKVADFAATYGAIALDSWRELVSHADVDLVMVCNTNAERGAIVRAALEADRHVVTEYPLALDPNEAAELVELARSRDRLLHVEHIELLGGVHQSLRTWLPKVGEVISARYSTIAPQIPTSGKWTYNRSLFGFPLVGALSRLHRLVDVFENVRQVGAVARYWPAEVEDYHACWCEARLIFSSGPIATVTYGKGDRFHGSQRLLEVRGSQGTLIYEGNQGQLIQGDQVTPLAVDGRQGLFARDTHAVLAYLLNGTPLYVRPEESLYTLRVADAAARSAHTGRPIDLL
jgi:biliverdin reductase